MSKTRNPRVTLYHYLRQNGDLTEASSSANANVNASAAATVSATDFYYEVASGEEAFITRMIVTIGEGGQFSADGYGDLAPLTTGIRVFLSDASGSVMTYLDNGVPIQGIVDWTRQCYDGQDFVIGTGIEFFNARWTFERAGRRTDNSQVDGRFERID